MHVRFARLPHEVLMAIGFAVAIVLFWLLLLGGVVLLFGPPHTA